MQEYFERKQSQERRIPAQKPVSETITISVAEYHCLTKAATLLEVILAAEPYHRTEAVEAVRKTIQAMQNAAEAGADQ